MEILVGIAFFAGLVWLLKTNARDNRSSANRRRTPPPTRPRRDYSVFDAKSAKPLIRDTSGTGPAQIRLFGIDAPELEHPYGQKAKWALVKLCKGRNIRAEITEKDHFGRTVAKCYLPDGRDLSAEMVKIGMAIDWPKFSGGIYRKLETPDARKKLWLATARQQGKMQVWEQFEAKKKAKGE